MPLILFLLVLNRSLITTGENGPLLQEARPGILLCSLLLSILAFSLIYLIMPRPPRRARSLQRRARQIRDEVTLLSGRDPLPFNGLVIGQSFVFSFFH